MLKCFPSSFFVIWCNRQAHTILRELMKLQREKRKNQEHLGTLRVYWKSLKYWIQLFNHLLYATLCFTYHTPSQILSTRSFLATPISFTHISWAILRRDPWQGKGRRWIPFPPLPWTTWNLIELPRRLLLFQKQSKSILYNHLPD